MQYLITDKTAISWSFVNNCCPYHNNWVLARTINTCDNDNKYLAWSILYDNIISGRYIFIFYQCDLTIFTYYSPFLTLLERISWFWFSETRAERISGFRLVLVLELTHSLFQLQPHVPGVKDVGTGKHICLSHWIRLESNMRRRVRGRPM